YAWAITGATVGGSLTPNKLAALQRIQKSRGLSDAAHINVMVEQCSLSLDDLSKLQTNAFDSDKRIAKIDALLESKKIELSKLSTSNRASLSASILAELASTECVVCLDAISDQIFLNCHHICVCSNCADLFRLK